MANHTGDAIDAVLAHFADLQISDEWRFNGQTFAERVEGYLLGAIESLEEEIESPDNTDQSEDSELATPADRVEVVSEEGCLRELGEMERLQSETQLDEARRDRARLELNDHLIKGHDPHTACCIVIYDLLHVNADVVAGEYVGSFLDWVFEDDAAERDRWRAIVGDQNNGVQQMHDFKKEGF